jgi:hypothetical protein
MLAKWTVTNDDELSAAMSAAYLLEGLYEGGEAVSRVESSEEENYRDVGAKSGGPGNVGIENVNVDPIRYDRPVRLEVSIECDCR